MVVKKYIYPLRGGLSIETVLKPNQIEKSHQRGVWVKSERCNVSLKIVYITSLTNRGYETFVSTGHGLYRLVVFYPVK